jgi:hypothetical protein
MHAQLPETWRHWRYAAPVEAAPIDQPRLVSVIVPNDVTVECAPGWADLRVIDETGREVPYLLDARHPREGRDWREARLLDTGVVPGQYSQVVLDLGAGPPVHNAVDVGLGGRDDVQAGLQIELSDDGQTWRAVGDRVPVFRLREAGRGERTDATYPASRSRYVRLRLFGGGAPVDIASARVAYESPTPADRIPAGVALAPAPADAESRESRWVSARAARTPVSEVRFETAAPQLARRVVVEVAQQRDRWRPVASGDILRSAASAERPLSLEFPEAAGHWRVTVLNGSDPPIADLTPVLYTTVRRVVFLQEPDREYRLLYGHARPAAPRYDFARLTKPEAIEAAVPARLAPAGVNGGWVDATPWTERHPALVWAAVAIAVLLVGVLAIRTLRAGVS